MLTHLTAEVRDRRYGCESPIPDLLDGRTVVDLGSGAGADCFIAARVVGEHGRVVGVDMTPELLDIARRNIEPICRNLGYATPNVEFRQGLIEELPLDDDFADVVISNCVINLSPEKERIFREVWRVLRPGGELYISDIVADRRIGPDFDPDPRLHSECLTGAAYLGDLHRILRRAGFLSVRLVVRRGIAEVVDGVHFESVIVRGFKLDLEDASEDYGQVAVYRGTIPGKARSYALDLDNVFAAGQAVRVCKNTADILSTERFARHFAVSAPIAHLGRFGAAARPVVQGGAEAGGCC
jgi:ubiquinone/menaquinone biosynthesis C-methylase UbiE